MLEWGVGTYLAFVVLVRLENDAVTDTENACGLNLVVLLPVLDYADTDRLSGSELCRMHRFRCMTHTAEKRRPCSRWRREELAERVT